MNMMDKKLILQFALMMAACCVGLPSMAQALSDPTRPAGMVPQGEESAEAKGPVLQSVMIAPGKRSAIISGKTVAMWESYGSYKVVLITENEVRLAQGSVVQVLKLYAGPEKRSASLPMFKQVKSGNSKTK